jgi:hypothetical protein
VPGAKVVIVTNDQISHTVTADNGNAFGVMISGGDTATLTATQART